MYMSTCDCVYQAFVSFKFFCSVVVVVVVTFLPSSYSLYFSLLLPLHPPKQKYANQTTHLLFGWKIDVSCYQSTLIARTVCSLKEIRVENMEWTNWRMSDETTNKDEFLMFDGWGSKRCWYNRVICIASECIRLHDTDNNDDDGQSVQYGIQLLFMFTS